VQVSKDGKKRISRPFLQTLPVYFQKHQIYKQRSSGIDSHRKSPCVVTEASQLELIILERPLTSTN
jgi:hypothetical protein